MVNATSFAAGGVAPGEIVTLKGTAMGPDAGLGLALDSAGKVATSLGGVSVSFNGLAAPLLYVSATQINCVVPYEVDGLPNLSVQVTYSGRTSTAYALSPVAAAPAIFPGAVLNETGSANSADSPAAGGHLVVFYLTGEGKTNPPGQTGSVTPLNTAPSGPLTPQPLLPIAVTIGGKAAPVAFYGEAPLMVAGVLQVNAQVPDGLPSGNQPLVVSFGGIASPGGTKVAVR